jgi:hypothetical protein
MSYNVRLSRRGGRRSCVLGVAGEVPVGAVDHLDARAHQPGELEYRHDGRERLGRERVPQVVRAAEVDPSCIERLVPVACAPVVEVDVAALRRGKDEGHVHTRREQLERRQSTAG